MESGQLSGGYVSSSFEAPTSLGVLSRRVLRRDAPGATVILIHESPGISDSTFEVASVLAREGHRLVLPELLDAAWSWKGPVHTIANVTKLCVARELGALALGQTGAIVEWLRALADEEHAATKRPVAVIGMCFSGGFALGTIRSSSVSAAVMSQPSLPFVFRIGRSDLGLSKGDLDAITARVGRGACIRAMRFSRDRQVAGIAPCPGPANVPGGRVPHGRDGQPEASLGARDGRPPRCLGGPAGGAWRDTRLSPAPPRVKRISVCERWPDSRAPAPIGRCPVVSHYLNGARRRSGMRGEAWEPTASRQSRRC